MIVCLLLSGCGLFITPQQRIDNARHDIGKGAWQAAAIELRTVLRSHDDNAEAWQELAELSLDVGDLNGAQSAVKHALAAGAKGSGMDTLRIRAWLAAGQPQAVLDAVTGHTVNPAEPFRSLAVARADLALGRTRDVVQLLQPLLVQSPELTDARVVLAEALAREAQLDEALSQLDQAMQHDSTSPLPALGRGSILVARGQYAAAESALDLALERMPPAQPLMDRVRVLILLTRAQLALGKIDAATGSQAALARLIPSAPVTGLLGARIALARGDLSEGVDELEGVVARAPRYVEPQLYLGATELARGDLQQAQQQLEQVVRAWPDNIEARKLLATVRLKLGQPEAALSVLTPVLGEQMVDPQLVALAGVAASRSGDRDALVQPLEQKLRSDPKDQALALNLSGLQARSGDVAAAKITLEGALAATPDSMAERLMLARVELAQGDLGHAQAALDQAIASRPGQAQVVENAGLILLESNQFDAALARFAQASALAPGDALCWLNTARAQLALNQVAAAHASLEKAAQIRPQWLPAVSMLALVDLHAGDGPRALARVNALLGGKPRDAGALALKGYVEAALGDTNAALSAYGQAQEIRPTAQVAIQLYRLRLTSHTPSPEKPLEDWLALRPNDAGVHEVLGEYLLGVRAWRAAARELEAALREAPRSVVALNNLAWDYSQLDDPRAEPTAERAYKLAPQSGAVDDTLGWILARRQEAARAVPLLAAAMKTDPDNPDIEYHYAYALVGAGKRDEGRRILTRILAASRPFDSRAAAQRLLASTQT
ncbi:MAG: tetratricopeptide repeat protein [Steroidobacteraceae bacterium]